VPPDSGVFGIVEGEACLYIGDTWNLRGRLLELANHIPEPDSLSIIWEQCPEAECATRRHALEAELIHQTTEDPARRLPGIQLRPEPLRRTA
jgi:hypothetical protein